ncbi:MAG TPA: hypothetical protein VFQ95_10095 [Rhodanobacteraceae bacterium]|nr:hypothetical protein [Rhodanobacteraceae bacterium]
MHPQRKRAAGAALALLACFVTVLAMATPPTRAQMQTQVHELDAKVAAAHTRNRTLQSQVTTMEQQNAARQQQLRQRDAEIAALQARLRAAGVPATAASGG